MAQYHAGCYIKSIKKLFENTQLEQAYLGLMNELSYFEMDTNTDLKPANNNFVPLAMIASNIISRGLPTRASLFIEKMFEITFRESKNTSVHYIDNHSDKDYLKKELFQALHIIEPRLDKDKITSKFESKWENFGTEHNENFYNTYIPEYLGEIYLQIFEQKNSFENILDFYSNLTSDDIKNQISDSEIIEHNFDFSISFPYPVNKKNGLIIEIDELKNNQLKLKQEDRERSTLVENIQWQKPYKYKADEFANLRTKIKPLQRFIDNEYFNILNTNYYNPIYKKDEGLNHLQYVLSPLAVVRIQKAVLASIIAGKLKLSDKEWKIGIIERDVPCAVLALEDLKQMLENLIKVTGLRSEIPQIILTSFYTKEFKDATLSKINRNYTKIEHRRVSLSNYLEYSVFDLFIDISVLQKHNLYEEKLKSDANVQIKIRSSFSKKQHRTFNTGKLIKYSPIFKKLRNNKTEIVPEREEAFKYFLKTIFDNEIFLPGQLELLNNTLQLENTVGLVPPNGGKSLIVQMAAFLQAGVCLAVTPTKALAINHTYNLNKKGIDCIGFIPAHANEETNRQANLQKLKCAGKLITFIEPEVFMLEDFRETLSEMTNQTYFSYLTVDEAHCVSEWSHDFRPEYSKLGYYAKLLCQTENTETISIAASTSTASYDVIKDITDSFSINTDKIIRVPFNFKKHTYAIHDIQVKNLFFNIPIEKASARIASTKQVNVSYLISNIYDEEKKEPYGSTLIFCPRKKGLYGITDANNDGLADKLQKTYKELGVGWFIGSNNDRKDLTDGNKSRMSTENFELFLKNENKILVGSRTMGIGIDVPKLKNIVHICMPGSIENFVQETGRAAGKNCKTNSVILYNNQIFQTVEESEIINKDNQEVYVENEIKTSIDKLILKENYREIFRGRKRELSVINELLYEITYPIEKPADILCDAIFDEFGIQVNFAYLPAKNPFQLFINRENKTFGYIDFRNNSVNQENSNLDKKTGLQLFNFIKKIVAKKCPKSRNIFRWLTNSADWPSLDGIVKQLDEMQEGEVREMVIHFRNDKTSRIADILNKNVSDSFTERMVYDISRTSRSAKNFIENLNNIANINLVNKNINLPERITKLFYEIRSEADTIKAIYRMWMLGIVNDYMIDYESKTISIDISKKSNNDYIKALYNYLIRHISESQAEKYCTNIKKTQKENITTKVLYFYIHFVYREISTKHYQGISHIDKLCNETIRSKNTPETKNKKINEYLTNFFESKYAEKLYSKNLYTDTKNFSEYNFSTVEHYINEVRGLKDNWMHLFKSTEKLLKVYTGNYVIMLLYSYSSFLLFHEDKEMFQKAFKTMIRGMIKMHKEEKINYQQYIHRIKLFQEKLYENNNTLRDKIAPLVWLKTHTIWLSEFNHNFLSNYHPVK